VRSRPTDLGGRVRALVLVPGLLLLLCTAQMVGHPVSTTTASRSTMASMLPDSIGPGQRDYLEPNAPNPFGSQATTTRIGYSISREVRVVLKVYDALYEEIMTVVDEIQPVGYHIAVFSAPSSLPSGVYFYELRAGDYYEIRRMLYVR